MTFDLLHPIKQQSTTELKKAIAAAISKQTGAPFTANINSIDYQGFTAAIKLTINQDRSTTSE